jgi:excisionase family DNA binding protein
MARDMGEDESELLLASAAIEALKDTFREVVEQSNPMLSIEEACDALKCGPFRLKDLIASGELPGLKVGKEWVIPREAFFRRVNQLAESGRLARLQTLHTQPLPNPQVGQRTRGRPPMPFRASEQ